MDFRAELDLRLTKFILSCNITTNKKIYTVSLVLSFIYPKINRDTRSHFKIRVLQTIKALDEHLVIVIVLVE